MPKPQPATAEPRRKVAARCNDGGIKSKKPAVSRISTETAARTNSFIYATEIPFSLKMPRRENIRGKTAAFKRAEKNDKKRT